MVLRQGVKIQQQEFAIPPLRQKNLDGTNRATSDPLVSKQPDF